MEDNSKMFKILIGFLVIIFGVFIIAQFSDSVSSESGSSTVNQTETFIGTEQAEGEELEQEEEGAMALEEAASSLCDCFSELLELKTKVKDNPRLEFELSGKTKQAEINMRKCYNKVRKMNMGLGEELISEFEDSCPDALDEL